MIRCLFLHVKINQKKFSGFISHLALRAIPDDAPFAKMEQAKNFAILQKNYRDPFCEW